MRERGLCASWHTPCITFLVALLARSYISQLMQASVFSLIFPFYYFFPVLALKVIAPAPVNAYIESPVFSPSLHTVWLCLCMSNLDVEFTKPKCGVRFCLFVFWPTWDFRFLLGRDKHEKATANSKPPKKTIERTGLQAWLLPTSLARTLTWNKNKHCISAIQPTLSQFG